MSDPIYTGELVSSDVTTKAFWEDAFERAAKSFLQVLVAVFTAGATIVSVSWPTLLLSAGLAALLSFGAALGTSVVPSTGNAVIDIASRAARTFAIGFVAAIPSTATSLADIDWRATAVIAASATVLSVLTSLGSLPVGPKGTPSLVPVA